jgi:hypothetical protein
MFVRVPHYVVLRLMGNRAGVPAEIFGLMRLNLLTPSDRVIAADPRLWITFMNAGRAARTFSLQ